MDQQKRVAIVTGAASGIGKSVAERYAQEGTAVVLSDVNQTLGEQAADQIRLAGGQATFVVADVSRPLSLTISATENQYGRGIPYSLIPSFMPFCKCKKR